MMKRLFTALADRLIALSERRPPDFVIGEDPNDPYLRIQEWQTPHE